MVRTNIYGTGNGMKAEWVADRRMGDFWCDGLMREEHIRSGKQPPPTGWRTLPSRSQPKILSPSPMSLSPTPEDKFYGSVFV